MIACSGTTLAHLGGWRGDRLSLSRDGAPLVPVADLGWDARTQTTPQRRIAVEGDAVFVLEPVAGALLRPPLRVRCFDARRGVETGREEGEGAEGEARDFFAMTRGEGGGVSVLRCGVDRATGRPQRVEAAVPDLGQLRRVPAASGTPLFHKGAWWYAIRADGVLRVGGEGDDFWPGDPAPVQALSGWAIAPGMRSGKPGVWVDGGWRPFPKGAPRLWPEYRSPQGPAVAPFRGGLVALNTRGGPLPALGAPSPRLPEGAYTGLVAVAGGLVSVAEGEAPRLVYAAVS